MYNAGYRVLSLSVHERFHHSPVHHVLADLQADQSPYTPPSVILFDAVPVMAARQTPQLR